MISTYTLTYTSTKYKKVFVFLILRQVKGKTERVASKVSFTQEENNSYKKLVSEVIWYFLLEIECKTSCIAGGSGFVTAASYDPRTPPRK